MIYVFGGPRRAERNVFCDRGQRRFGTSQMLPPTYCLPTAYLLPTYFQPIQCLQYNLFPYIFSTGKKEDELCAGNLQRQLFVHTHFCNVLTNTSGSQYLQVFIVIQSTLNVPKFLGCSDVSGILWLIIFQVLGILQMLTLCYQILRIRFWILVNTQIQGLRYKQDSQILKSSFNILDITYQILGNRYQALVKGMLFEIFKK